MVAINKTTPPYQLAEMMGSDATYEEGTLMLDVLMENGVNDTDDLTTNEWLGMIDSVIERNMSK